MTNKQRSSRPTSKKMQFLSQWWFVLFLESRYYLFVHVVFHIVFAADMVFLICMFLLLPLPVRLVEPSPNHPESHLSHHGLDHLKALPLPTTGQLIHTLAATGVLPDR